jgi:hypothetical protein
VKLALLADIHEDVDRLRAALHRVAREDIDQVVVLGDVFAMGERIAETCQILADARAVGVWGNHDFGLCYNVDDRTRCAYPAEVIEYMASLRPRLELDGCMFTHVEPWLNPEVLADLWYYDGPPDEQRKLDRIFSATPERILFAGHYHRWLLAGPGGLVDWDGTRIADLRDGRWFAVIGALCEGRYAVYDTESCHLTPFNEE